MKQNNIIKYAGVGILSAIVGTNIGMIISDNVIDHTETICPIAKFENMLPFTYEGNKIGVYHQKDNMQQDYFDKGINAYCTSEEGKIPASIGDTETRYWMVEDIDGKKCIDSTEGMKLFEKDGIVWGEKEVQADQVDGYIITSTYKINGKEKTKTLNMRK